jgi:hypothetical protein
VQSIKDGSTLTFEMRSWPDDTSKEPLDVRHYGPCAFYLKKVTSAVEDKAAGDGWFKLFDQGYDAGSGKWCTDNLIANKGRMSVKIPENLAGGYYLARPEVLALHNATNGDGQFYTGCGQIFVESKGDLGPDSTVSIPGYVKEGEPSVKFNIYNNKNAEYKVPGPAVAKLVSGGGVAKGAASSGQTTQTEGQKPAGCILESGNWCGKEVAAYSDEKGCWASGEDCWAQAKTCWAQVGPTGGKGCEIWQNKCTAMNDGCKAKQFKGPPDMGKNLTPAPVKIEVGNVMGKSLDVSAKDVEAKPSSAAAVVEAKPTSSVAASAAASEKVVVSSQAAPSSAPSSKVAQQPKPSASQKSKSKGQSKPTLTVTQGPGATNAACPRGYHCVTNVNTVVETKVQYVTLEAGQRRRGVHFRRHRGL